MAVPRMIVPESVGARTSGAAVRFVPQGAEQNDARSTLYFTEKLNETLETESAVRRMGTLAEAQSTFTNDLDRKRLELLQDPDIAGREAKFQEYAKKRHAEIGEGMDGKTRATFTRAANPVADSYSVNVRHQARTDNIEKAVVGLRNSNDALVLKAGDARNPVERGAIVGQIETNIQQAFDNGWLTPAQYESEKKQTLTKVDQAEALRLIRENPSGMIQQLAKSDFLPNLDPVARQNLIDKAGNEQLRRASLAYTQAARAEVAERRALRVQGTEAMKNIYDLNETGQLTEGVLQQYRPVLDETQWKAARGMLRGGAVEDSKDSLMVLETGIGTRDMTDSINGALAANRITMPTYRSLMSRNENALKDDQPASPYRRGREQLIEGLKPGALLSGTAADLQRQALVAALREYDEFALGQGVQKIRETPRLALDRADDIRQRYAIVNFNQMTQALGVPRFVDKAADLVTEADLMAAGRRVLEEFDRKGMSADERDIQLRKIEQWSEALKQRDKNKPNPAMGDRP